MLVWFAVRGACTASLESPTNGTNPLGPSTAAHRLQRKNAVAHILAQSTAHVPTSASPKPAKLQIVSVSPTTLSANGNEPIEIVLNSSFTPPVFCRFNEAIVMGRVAGPAQLVCRSPRLREGELLLAISLDKVKWSPAVVLSVVADDSDLPWVAVTIGGFVVLAVALFALRMLCGRRAVPKRRQARRRKLADGIGHPPELHHRRNLQSPL
jgi:hypothetical protein